MLDEPENSQQSQPASHVSSSPRHFWQNITNFTQGVKKEAKIPSLEATENPATPEAQPLPEADGGTDSQESDDEFDFDWGDSSENGQPIDVEGELEAFLSRFLTEDSTTEPLPPGTDNSNLAKLSQLSRRMNESLMAQVLEESQPEERGEIIRIAYESGVRKEDLNYEHWLRSTSAW